MEEEDNVLEELKTKMEEYFKNNKVIEKKEDLDGFLEAIGLLEVWNSEEEKEVCWQCLNKYNKKGIIDLNAAINGIKDLMNQEDEEESHETILTHLSRRASVREPQKNKVSISKMKQIALDEYECIDEETLFQLKKIFSLLNINNDNCRIKFNNLQDVCTNNKFIKITPEEIWKYLSFLSIDNNEGKTYRPMLINMSLFTEIENFINEKLPPEEIEEKINEKDENEIEEDSDEDEPMDIIEKIINNSDNIQGESMAFNEIIKSLNILINDMVEKAQNILNGNDNNLEDVLFVKDLMTKKISDLNKHNKIIEKNQKSNNSKMEKIQFFINKLKTDLQNLENDYKELNNKYENHQKNVNNNDEEIERLFGENLMLIQDKESKEKEIEQLNEEKKELDNKYNNLFIQLNNSLKKNKDIQNEINEIKIKNLKYKTDYENALEKLINLEKTYNQELLKNEQKKSKEEEDLNKEEDTISFFAKQQGLLDQNFNFSANKRRSQVINLPKNIPIISETNEEKLAKYVKELEKMNEILTERNKDSNMKVKELENLLSKKVDISNKIINKEADPKKLVKLNEIFNPSLYEINYERICLIGEFNNFNPKKNKIVKKYNFTIKNAKKKSSLLKQNSVEINYHEAKKEIKKQDKFNKNLEIINKNSSFNIINIKPIKIEENKKTLEIKLSKSNFNINICNIMKKKINYEKAHTDFCIINKNNNQNNQNNNNSKEYKIENIEKFNIIKKLSIEEKRNELVDDSKKINLLFNDDSATMNSNKNFNIEKIKDIEEDVGSFSTKEVRSNTIMIHPKDLFESKDYYCLYQEEYVRRKLGHLNDLCSEKNIYSDQVYVLVEKKQLLKKYLMLTPNNFCIIEQSTLKFVYVDKIKNIKNIVISNKNLNMILFRFSDGEDLVIESLRPYDLILYLKKNYFSNSKDSMFRYEDKFIIKLKGQLHSLIVTDKILTSLLNFDGALKVGYLYLYKAKFISSNFTETIGILIDVGLLLMEESTLRPIALIPILGSIVKKVEKERFGNNNCFEIILPSGVTRVFSVRKSRERDSWLAQISKMKKDHDEKMKKIGAVKKVSTKKLIKLK